MNIGSLFGQLWNARDIWTYWPPGLFWKVCVVAVVLVAVPSLYFRFGVKTYRDAYVASQEQKARLSALEAERYVARGPLLPITSLPPAPADPAQPQEQVQVFAKEAEQLPDGTVVQDAALVTEKTVSRFAFILLPTQSAWVRGSATEFEGLDGKPVGIETALRKDYVEALVKQSDKVVCIGLASAEPAPPGHNLLYSDDRAINLCRALHNITFADESRQGTFGLAMGEYQPAQGETVEASRQRAAILVGIQDSRRNPKPEDLIRALVQLLKVPGVNLERYKRSDGFRIKTFSRVGGGALTGFAGSQWDQTTVDEDANPFDDESTARPQQK